MTPSALSLSNGLSLSSWRGSIVLTAFVAAQLLSPISIMEVAAFQAHIPEVSSLARLGLYNVHRQESNFKKALFLGPRKQGSIGTSRRSTMKPFAMSTLAEDATTVKENAGTAMDDSQLGAWVPLHSVSALKDIQPSKVTVMNIDFVVWYDNIHEKWSVASDVCPHRLAPLSQGRVDEKTGCIECPYHGWEFHGNGTNAEIPQWSGTPEEFQKATADPNSRLHATGHPVHVIGDLIFVWLPTSVHGESFPKSVLPEDMYQGLAEQADQDCKYYVRELPYSFDMLVENFMDPAHIPFAHHGLQAERVDGSDIPMTVLVNNFTNIEVGYQDLNKNKTNDRVVSFQRPNYYHFRTMDKETGEYKKSLQIYCIPVRAGQCRAMFQTISIGFIPDWLSHAGSNRFLNTDTWLHTTERVLKSPDLSGQSATDESAYVMASTSDIGVKAFRAWWKQNGFANAPPHTFGSATQEQLEALHPLPLSRREQIDPWVHHTEHCSTCRGALNNWKKVERWSLGFSFASAAFLGSVDKPILAAVLSVAGVAMHFFSKNVATIMEGNPSKAGVDDRSVAATK